MAQASGGRGGDALRTDRLLLGDMLEAIGEVLSTTPSTRVEFDGDKLVRSHVLRNIQIIGEVAWRLSPAVKDAHAEVPWRAIAGMRHALVHDYFQVDWDAVWSVAQQHMSTLEAQVEAILVAIPPDPNVS